MNFKIENGPVFTTLSIKLAKGESIKAEAGAMIAMSPTIELQAKTTGKGLMGALKSAIGGESMFASHYTANGGDGELILAPAIPGDIISFDLNNQVLFAQSGAYLAGSPELELAIQGSLKGMLSGEGLFLQKISGTGKVFLNSYGAVIEKKLAAGESFFVDTGHIVAFESSVQYQLKKAAKGLFSSVVSGEGIVCQYQGPGTIWFQTRNLPALANLLAPLLPKQSG